jgi:hypothetical protein
VLLVVRQVACGWDILFGVREKTVGWVQPWEQAAEVAVAQMRSFLCATQRLGGA